MNHKPPPPTGFVPPESKINDTSKTVPRLIDTSKTLRKVDFGKLGAKDMEDPPIWIDPPDCPRCGYTLKPLKNSHYGTWQCDKHPNDKSVWFDYELIMMLRARVPKKQTNPYLVVGDHPIAPRPDKRFPDELIARAYAEDLRKQGYDNVAVFKMEGE